MWSLNRFQISRRSARKASLDDIYFEAFQLKRNLKLFFAGECHSCGLLSIAESCIKDIDFFCHAIPGKCPARKGQATFVFAMPRARLSLAEEALFPAGRFADRSH
jgi:hypothetical protein